MNTNYDKDCHSHAEFCLQQSQLAEDCKVKKHWADLASGWLILEDMELQSVLPAKIKLSA